MHSLTTARRNGTYQTRCECGDASDWLPNRWQAEDWATDHEAQVARVRAHLGRRAPSLTDQRNWYRVQAELATSERERLLWKMLADGLDHRIGKNVEETPLFEDQS